MAEYSKAPETINKLFVLADRFISAYFSKKKEYPTEGIIDVVGDRYIMIRAASMSVDFFDILRQVYGKYDEEIAFDQARNLLFDIAHAIGKNDARFFASKNELQNPLDRLSAGPPYYAFTGWGYVEILPGSHLVPNDNFMLIYSHRNSFEADSWIQSGKKADFPVCLMNAGYSSGWCEECFGISLVATEISCRAMGAEQCRFVMAPPHKLRQRVREISDVLPETPSDISIPKFFHRKEIEQKLRESELKFRKVFEHASDAIFLLKSSRITEVNAAAEELLGYDASSLVNRNIFDFSAIMPDAEDTPENLWTKYMEMAKSGLPTIFKWHFINSAQALVETEISLNIVFKDASLFQAICRNLSKRKHLEAQLLQSQKMQAIGSLAEGIAHDFNNILGGILGFISLLKIKTPQSEISDMYIRRIEKSIEKAGELTRQLLSFSRKNRNQVVALSLNDCIHDMMKLIQRTISRNIEIHLNLQENLPLIEGDPSQIEQLILNLCLNASHALPSGGDITIRTWTASQKELLENDIAIDAEQGAVCLEIEDNGIGMDSETRERIFEPYFTSRANDGFGLGMTIVYNIVKSHRGNILIHSEIGKGTRFTMYFPATKKTRSQKTVSQDVPIIGGNELILIVDDDEEICDFLEDFAKSIGYSVISARNGEEAIRICRRVKDIALVIINSGMPKMDGVSTIQNIRTLTPTIRVILTSGLHFSEEEIRKLHAKGIHEFIQKPFSLEKISRVIRKVLDENPA